MGKSLSYCFKCSRLIREEEFAKGKAYNLGDRVSCAACAREVGAVVVPGAPAPLPVSPPTPRTKVVVIRQPAPSMKPVALVAVGAFVLVGVVIAGVIAFSRDSEPPAPVPPPPREIAPRQDLESARKVSVEPKAKQPTTEKVAPEIDPGLVGHWTFDEGQGASVLDSSGRAPAGVIKEATWVEGRLGKALRFNGVRSYVELPNTPELDTLQENSFTIAAWFKPEGEPPDREGFNGYAIVMKAGKHVGLIRKGQIPAMDYWFHDGSFADAQGPNHPLLQDRFYHLAGVVDRSEGLVRIVVDGKELGTGKFDREVRSWEFNKAPWRIGMAHRKPGVWALPAKGIIDDVRLYRRALTDEEIRRLIPK